jgi:hypothetical protein
MKSLPNYVFLSFGSKDSNDKSFTEEKFINSYVSLINQVQKMPTKPMVFLMVPVEKDMQETIKKIANQTSISDKHIVNAWSMLRDPKREVPGIGADNATPNLKGNGEIAQEFFMKMAFSPEYMERQSKILKGQDQIFNKAIES